MVDKPRYDVAISFVMEDMETARRLHDELANGLRVFFFARQQEEIAGRSGHDKFRDPFLECRLAVVLYRERWGKRGWTEVEQSAIQDGCLKHGWSHLMFVAMDGSQKPNWVPNHPIRYDIAQFGFDDLVGAIKSRVMELGGEIKPMTVAQRAERHRAEVQYQAERKRFRETSDGTAVVAQELQKVFSAIARHCDEVRSVNLGIRCGYNAGRCVITNDRVSLVIGWRRPGLPGVDEDELQIEEWETNVALPAERPLMYFEDPPRRRIETYEIDLSKERVCVWRSGATSLTSSVLAEHLLMLFFNLADRLAQPRR